RAEVVITLRGAVEVRDFVLQNPDRLVIDLLGAKLSAVGARYDGVNRGGVVNLRYSQYRPDVVRIVHQLDGAKDYNLIRTADAVRVSFGADDPFLAWSSRGGSARAARAPEVQLPPAAPLLRDRAQQPRITVTWDKASIADVVAGFAAFSGRTIILGKDIKGEVTAEIKNQPWDQAFQAILATQGLSATEMAGGIIRVDSP